MALATPSLGSSGSFLGCPVRGIYEFPGFWGFDRLFPVLCTVLHCIALRRMCMRFASCFTCIGPHCSALP